jgi:hypothetical protein
MSVETPKLTGRNSGYLGGSCVQYLLRTYRAIQSANALEMQNKSYRRT